MYDEIVKELVEKKWSAISKKPNVIGYSGKLQLRETNGKLIPNTRVFRVHVVRKLPESCLKESSIIPRCLSLSNKQIETDVVKIGKLTAPPSPYNLSKSKLKKLDVDKTAKIRPVPLGVSIGNWSITAGSLGMLYKVKEDNKLGITPGINVAGTNAHVASDGPEKKPEEVIEKRVLQPGSYHGGKTEDNIVGTYVWHQRIFPDGIPSECTITKLVAKIYNKLSKQAGRHARLSPVSVGENNIDFAVYLPSTEHIKKVADNCLDEEPFIGHLFAGSEAYGIICKVKYIIDLGLEPLVPIAEVKVGDTVRGCSFWCHYTTTVFDDSGVITVSYGDWNATFTDVIIVSNDGSIRGGCSGSGYRKLNV